MGMAVQMYGPTPPARPFAHRIVAEAHLGVAGMQYLDVVDAVPVELATHLFGIVIARDQPRSAVQLAEYGFHPFDGELPVGEVAEVPDDVVFGDDAIPVRDQVAVMCPYVVPWPRGLIEYSCVREMGVGDKFVRRQN